MTILVLDLGSSSVRAFLYDEDLTMLAQVSRKHRFATEPPGASMIEAAELERNVEACLDEILQHEGAGALRAVGMDTFAGNVLGVDGKGNAVTPVYTYADTRSAEDVAALAEKIDAAAMHQRTGTIHHSAYQPGRIAWVRRTEPETYAKVAQWIDLGTYLYRRWFGDNDAPACISVASWSGMLNRETLDWEPHWLDVLELPKTALPALADYSDGRTGLSGAYAKRWTALKDVPFYLGVGDGAAANVGSGCVEPGQVALSIGTTAALRTVSTDKLPPVPPGLWSYRISAGLHLIGGATSEGGSIFEWVRNTVRLPDDAEDQLMKRSPDEHGLTFLPLLAGERSPGWAADATGVIDGLRLSTTPLDILQAALEGVALRLALIDEQLGDDQAVTVSGRALEASPAWAQMIANALDRPLMFSDESEITARGTAILALCALDQRPLTDFPLTITTTIEPQPDAVPVMRAARVRQERLYAKFYAKRN
jgi:gluconokinase